MKKLLVLALVLSMAATASAALQINGAPAMLVVGDSMTLAISTDAPIAFGVGDWAGLALVTDITMGSFSGGVSNDPLEPGMVVYADAAVDLGFVVPTAPLENGIGFMLVITGGGEPIGNLFTGINYTVLQAGLHTLTLWGSQDYVNFENLGTVAIMVGAAPEPMTLGLLGLGGLFLRRRK